jgi:TorA maturation chaperone TorD
VNIESPRLDAGPLSEEEAARANFYALIGRLFYAAPDAGLLAALCSSDGNAGAADGGGPLVEAWASLLDACRSAHTEMLEAEYAALFISAGKSLVSPYVSGYASGMAADKQLVRLRQQLEAWGLARRDAVFEIEDHIAGLCDVMRFLIECNQPVADQKQFFEEFVQPGALRLCDAVEAAEPAVFYKNVASFMRAFFALEKSAFDMEA